MPKAPSVKWTREHFLIALNLYCKLPFGKFDRTNKVVIDVASKMGRTPSSLAMKLGNFASLDPVQRARGIKGLSGATKQDQNDVERIPFASSIVLHPRANNSFTTSLRMTTIAKWTFCNVTRCG